MWLEIYEHLLAQYAATCTAAAGEPVTPGQAFPDFARPDVVLPTVVLEYAGWQADKRTDRLGEAQAHQYIGFRGWLFARNEPQLLAMGEALLGWHKRNNALNLAAGRVGCLLQQMPRHEPQSTARQEQHAVVFMVQVDY